MAFLAALPEVAEAAGGAEGAAGGAGMLSKIPLVGQFLGGGKGGSKPNPEQAQEVAHARLGALNANQFG